MNPATDNSGTGTPQYVQVTLGRTRLLFPRTELLSLEATPEIGPVAEDGSIGKVTFNNTCLPVYNFDELLQLSGQAQDDRRTCACLGNGNLSFGLLCDKAEIVDSAGIQMVPLPSCMRTGHTPVQALALQGSRILCITSLEGMAGMIGGAGAAVTRS